MRIAGLLLGIILVLLGLVWIGQGSNLIGGSVMSGQSLWLYVGIAVLVVGAIVLWGGWRSRRG